VGQLAAFVVDEVLELEMLELEVPVVEVGLLSLEPLEPLNGESDLAAGWSDFSDDFSPLAGAPVEVLPLRESVR
jgi:hypothetical protein